MHEVAERLMEQSLQLMAQVSGMYLWMMGETIAFKEYDSLWLCSHALHMCVKQGAHCCKFHRRN